MLVRMRREMGAEEPTVSPEIDTLVLLDRYPLLLYSSNRPLTPHIDVDMVTPCCTQLTYEGLIDEVFQIVNSMYL